MAQAYNYRVRDLQGQIHNGTVEAENRHAVLQKFQESGYLVVHLEEKKETPTFDHLEFRFKRVKLKDLAIFSRQFAVMLRAGISIVACLEILSEQTANSHLRRIIQQVKRDVEGGLPLSDALEQHPEFPLIFSRMIRAGESGGVLERALMLLAQHFDKEYHTMQKIKGAMAYPMLVTAFAIVIVGGLITFVLPMFVKNFAASGVALPLPTRILLAISDFIRGYFPLLILAILVGSWAFYRFINTEKGRYWLDSLLLRLPILGELFRKLAVFRFSRVLGDLVRSGLPIIQSMEAVAQVVGNKVITRGVIAAKNSVKEGDDIARPLAAVGVFPPMVTQMITVGEESGRLDEMLEHIGDYSESEVDYMVDNLTHLLEPILIVLVAGVVAFIVLSIMLPMYGSMRLQQ